MQFLAPLSLLPLLVAGAPVAGQQNQQNKPDLVAECSVTKSHGQLWSCPSLTCEVEGEFPDAGSTVWFTCTTTGDAVGDAEADSNWIRDPYQHFVSNTLVESACMARLPTCEEYDSDPNWHPSAGHDD